MTWTRRSESGVVCGGALGPVRDDENVARLLVKMTPPSGWRPFNRAQFAIPDGGQFSNTCGESDGCSVDRSNGLSAEKLQSRSEIFAAQAQALAEARKPQKIVRTGGGAVVAEVSALRAVRTSKDKNRQVLFIYADPIHKATADDTRENIEHAVIRADDCIAEEDWPILLEDVAKAFSKLI